MTFARWMQLEINVSGQNHAGCIYVFRDICMHACMRVCVCLCETTIEDKEATSKVSEQGGYWREERGRGK